MVDDILGMEAAVEGLDPAGCVVHEPPFNASWHNTIVRLSEQLAKVSGLSRADEYDFVAWKVFERCAAGELTLTGLRQTPPVERESDVRTSGIKREPVPRSEYEWLRILPHGGQPAKDRADCGSDFYGTARQVREDGLDGAIVWAGLCFKSDGDLLNGFPDYVSSGEAIAYVVTRDRTFSASCRGQSPCEIEFALAYRRSEQPSAPSGYADSVWQAAERLTEACRERPGASCARRGTIKGSFDGADREDMSRDAWENHKLDEHDDRFLVLPEYACDSGAYWHDPLFDFRLLQAEFPAIPPVASIQPVSDEQGVRTTEVVEPAGLLVHAEETLPAKPESKMARRRGNASLAPVDEALVEEMDSLIESKVVASVLAAAKEVAPRAAGYGTLDSKIDRLRRRYSETYPAADPEHL